MERLRFQDLRPHHADLPDREGGPEATWMKEEHRSSNWRESVRLGLLLADYEKNYVTYAAGDSV
jgi:hypothetical protein